MPEGDSVYRLAARLHRQVARRRIVAGELRSGTAAGTSLAGLSIARFETHGKHLVTHLDPGWALHTHLLMQGSWSVTAAGRSLPARRMSAVRIRAALDDGRTLWGIDMPVVELWPSTSVRAALAHLGPDPLRPDWDAAEAARRLRSAAERPMVAALLDQRIIAGLGNLWVNEIAFLSGVHPRDPAGTTDADALVARASRMLRISAREEGMYQITTGDRRRGRSHWVAGRAGKPCLRCGTTIRVQAEISRDPERRRTWWCPYCQPAVS